MDYLRGYADGLEVALVALASLHISPEAYEEIRNSIVELLAENGRQADELLEEMKRLAGG